MAFIDFADNCNTKIGITGFNIENEIMTTTLTLSTTILLSHIEFTWPISFTSIFEVEKESTFLTSIPDLISNTIQTTMIIGFVEEKEEKEETYNLKKKNLKLIMKLSNLILILKN